MNLKDYLIDDVTFVLEKDGKVHTFNKRGIAPILDLLSDNKELLNQADVADRVIGKAAAMLLAKANIKSLYTVVISEHAIPVLEEYNIPYSYKEKVPYIINRTNTGMCPMEECSMSIASIDEAEEKLRARLKELAG